MTIRIDGTNTAANPGITGSDTDTGLQFGTDEVNVVTGGTTAVTVDSSQRLGVGITSPTTSLHVSGANTGARGQVSITGASADARLTFYRDSTFLGHIAGDTSNGLSIQTESTYPLKFSPGGNERMSLTSNGYMRLGDTNYYHTIRGGGGNEALEITANAGQQNASSVSNIKFFTSNAGAAITERMRITSDGKVLINRTSGIYTEQFLVESNTQTVNPMTVSNTDTDNSAEYSILFRRNTSLVGSIQTTLSATNYVTSSDHRLKENVVPLTGAADRVNQLQVRRFNFIADPDTTVDGFIAHEAQAVVPEAVTGTQDEVEVWKEGEELPDGVSVGDNKLDEDGNTIPVYQGIDQSKLVPLLTAALQEALAKIETLETRLTALEGGTN